MPEITINRTGMLEKPMGLGQGRVSEGRISADWATTRTIKAGSLGLRSLTNIVLTPGTPLDVEVFARVVSPGSLNNSASIRAYLKQTSKIRVGTVRYTTYPLAFTGSPDLSLAPGSPTTRITAITTGSARWPYVYSQRPGSFSHQATPTFVNTGYVAVGPGSFPVNYIAVGD